MNKTARRLGRYLFNAAAAVEVATGVALLFAPVPLIELFVAGVEASPGWILVTRVLGMGLFSLGLAAWEVAGEPPKPMARVGLCVYNLGVAVVMSLSAFGSGVAGPLLWPIAGLHAIAAVLMLMTFTSRFRERSWAFDSDSGDG